MTASFVLMTAAAVLLVEVVAIGFIIPNFLASQDLISRVRYSASDAAYRVALASTSATTVVLPPDFVLGDPSVTVNPGRVQTLGSGVVIPLIAGSNHSSFAQLTLAMVFTRDGTLIASSYPARYALGSHAYAVIPGGSKSVVNGADAQVAELRNGRIAWAIQPVLLRLAQKSSGFVKGAKPTPDAYVYVQGPLQAQTILSATNAAPMLQVGLVVLLLSLPVGALFGFLTTRGLVRRLRGLAQTTGSVADGDFSRRVVPGSRDEVGELEHNFNEMAERLSAAMSRERALADSSARQAERSRIARDLHDSISQDLFSINLLAAGLDKALPKESPLRAQVQGLLRAAQSTNREMRALLLELRPAALDERGLIPTLRDLASTYSERLGINVELDLEPLRMEPAAELAGLRIAQEGLANAVRHAQARTIRLELHGREGRANITISDDGHGFDPKANGTTKGLGLRLMRERVEEMGGTLDITSDEATGTVVAASLPGVVR